MSALLAVWDDTMGRAKCRSCDAKITWFQMVKSGKKMPFDGEPVYIKTETDPASGQLIGYVDSSINASHFATCPDRNDWRRPK